MKCLLHVSTQQKGTSHFNRDVHKRELRPSVAQHRLHIYVAFSLLISRPSGSFHASIHRRPLKPSYGGFTFVSRSVSDLEVSAPWSLSGDSVLRRHRFQERPSLHWITWKIPLRPRTFFLSFCGRSYMNYVFEKNRSIRGDLPLVTGLKVAANVPFLGHWFFKDVRVS